jgi:hypothetical protein
MACSTWSPGWLDSVGGDDQVVAVRSGTVVATVGAIFVFWAAVGVAPWIAVTGHLPSSKAWAASNRPVMHMEKLDKGLIEEINARVEAAKEEGKGPEDLQHAKFEVVIELAQSPAPPKGLPRDQALRELERQIEQSQAKVVATLQRMGVTTFDRLVLSGGIAVDLTLDQIKKVSDEPDVKLIRLRQVRKVTTTGGGSGLGAAKP